MNKKYYAKKKSNIFSDNKGQTLVEMAFVLPVILLMIMGMIEFGRIFNTYIIVTNASREGARIAAVGGTDLNINTSVTNASPTLDSTKVTVDIQPIETSRSRGNEVTVTVNYSLEIICPVISSIIPNPFTINSSTVMRME